MTVLYLWRESGGGCENGWCARAAAAAVQLLCALGVEVRRLVGDDLDADLALAKDVVAHDFHALVQRLPRRLVVVEEVAGEEDHVGAVLQRQFEDLAEGDKGIVAADRAALAVA